MPLYTVRLESPITPQWRQRTFEAENHSAAARFADRLELNRCAYSLLNAKPDPLLQHEDERGRHAQVNCDALAGLAPTGPDLLDLVTREHGMGSNGKVWGPEKWMRAHLDAHLQTEPYRITSIQRVDPTAALVEELRRLQQDPDQWDLTLQRLHAEGVPIAAVTAQLYGLTWQKQIDGSSTPCVWGTGSGGNTIKTSLHTGYTLDMDAHDFFNDVSGTEVAATGGYTTGGVTLTSKTTNYTSATDLIWLDAADVSWTTSTISATDAIVTNTTPGTAATNPLLGAVDFGATVSTSSGTFQITWDATAGIIAYDIT